MVMMKLILTKLWIFFNNVFKDQKEVSKEVRAVSQCAIEQAAREAEEQAQRERAAKIAALAQQGGYDSACNMLTSQYGESRTEQLIEQLLRQVKEKMTKLR